MTYLIHVDLKDSTWPLGQDGFSEAWTISLVYIR